MHLIALALRACFLVALTAASTAWLRWVQRRVPPGPARFIAAAPVMATYLLAPLLFDTATEVAAVVGSINLPWLSNTVVSFGASHAACTALVGVACQTARSRRSQVRPTLQAQRMGCGQGPAGATAAAAALLLCLPGSTS